MEAVNKVENRKITAFTFPGEVRSISVKHTSSEKSFAVDSQRSKYGKFQRLVVSAD